ncbi:MAG TPA: LLM class flavin-dependent oxidoreductase [Kineosporiaceae bacterium]|nr:LLM class flavin-dependent oxidoreductase [Kineosporiaceae bacterium]
MKDRPFRFGVVATPEGADQWRSTAQRVAELGYSTLLMPDGMQLLSPFPSLAAAAASTPGLRVGTFVIAAPLRPPRSAAWEAHSLSVLTDGRFELGIGTGLPRAGESALLLGLPNGTLAERLVQVEETIDQLRELDGDRHTPVLMAAGGPKSRALAAAKADIVTVAVGPLATREEVSAMLDDVRDQAGERADDLELAMNLFVIGDELPPWTRQFIGVDADELIAHDSLTMLRGGTHGVAPSRWPMSFSDAVTRSAFRTSA